MSVTSNSYRDSLCLLSFVAQFPQAEKLFLWAQTLRATVEGCLPTLVCLWLAEIGDEHSFTGIYTQWTVNRQSLYDEKSFKFRASVFTQWTVSYVEFTSNPGRTFCVQAQYKFNQTLLILKVPLPLTPLLFWNCSSWLHCLMSAAATPPCTLFLSYCQTLLNHISHFRYTSVSKKNSSKITVMRKWKWA